MCLYKVQGLVRRQKDPTHMQAKTKTGAQNIQGAVASISSVTCACVFVACVLVACVLVSGINRTHQHIVDPDGKNEQQPTLKGIYLCIMFSNK